MLTCLRLRFFTAIGWNLSHQGPPSPIAELITIIVYVIIYLLAINHLHHFSLAIARLRAPMSRLLMECYLYFGMKERDTLHISNWLPVKSCKYIMGIFWFCCVSISMSLPMGLSPAASGALVYRWIYWLKCFWDVLKVHEVLIRNGQYAQVHTDIGILTFANSHFRGQGCSW